MSTISAMQQATAALDRQGIRRASATVEGYRVEQGPTGATHVYWGRGEPFTGTRMRGDRKLAACARVLGTAGFRLGPGEHEDHIGSKGRYFVAYAPS